MRYRGNAQRAGPLSQICRKLLTATGFVGSVGISMAEARRGLGPALPELQDMGFMAASASIAK